MAAKEHSFDISGEINIQELKNAIEQAKKEATGRFDFKDCPKDIDFNEKAKTITLLSSSDSKLDALYDILLSKVIKREISTKALTKNEYENASGGNKKCVIGVKDALGTEDAKKVNKIIKDSGIKVSATIQGETIRVVSKEIDSLQAVMQKLKASELDFPLSFKNLK